MRQWLLRLQSLDKSIGPCVTTVGLCLEDQQYKCPLHYSVSPAGQINTDQLQEGGKKINKSPFLIGQKHPCDSSNTPTPEKMQTTTTEQ